MATIGFIGLGRMGSGMAGQLLKAGYTVLAYDVLPQAVLALTKQGAQAATSLPELAEQAEVIITSVQTSQQVADICLQHDGIFSHARPHLLYIDCSSIDITTTQFLHQEADKLEITMLDAPVSGGVLSAQAGTLTFMVGGSESAFQQATPLLKAMGKNIIHAGPAGHGQAAKICNNLLLGISMIGVSEAFALANKLGLDQKKFFDISSQASGQCWSMTHHCPVPHIITHAPANNGYQPGFTANLMLKDLRLGQHAAESVQATIPLGSIATELYELYVNQGMGETDFSGIIRLFTHSQ